MTAYTMGFDFGSLSVRGILVDVYTGKEVGTAVYEYPHGIMEDHLPDGTKIPEGFALQHPMDYLNGLSWCSRELLAQTGIDKEAVVGIGLDTTASTVLPLGENREPLCFQNAYRTNPHAWLKLWKHRGNMEQAERITSTAARFREPWLDQRGGILSCEFFLPKAVELAESDVCEATVSILEIADWLTEKLTGNPCRSRPLAESNGCYLRGAGYPSDDFLEKAAKDGRCLRNEKLTEPVIPAGKRAGVLCSESAQRMGLREGIAVAVPFADAHASVCASGANRVGDMVYICGTSAVEILLTGRPTAYPGVHISGRDISVPGYYSAGCGQSSVGDSFSWFMKNLVPQRYYNQAASAGTDIYTLLSEKAAKLHPGQSGLLAIDWWNGARTPYFDFTLTGSIFGLNLHTKPEEIWRAMLEAHAFNVRKSMILLMKAGHRIDRIFATGGIPGKNPVLMQVLADVVQKDIYVCQSPQPGALGSAIFGAAAAFEEEPLEAIIARMCSKSEVCYHPSGEYEKIYDKLYAMYDELTDQYGKTSSILKELRQLRR